MKYVSESYFHVFYVGVNNLELLGIMSIGDSQRRERSFLLKHQRF